MHQTSRVQLKRKIQETLRESLRTQEAFFRDNLEQILEASNLFLRTFRKGGKVLIVGNGGSAADAQHLAAELVNRYLQDRPALPAVALTTDTSILTSIGNDHDFEHIFSRQVEALGKRGDLLVAISTSGNSPNVLEAVRGARKMGIQTLALTGGDGGRIRKLAHHTLCVSSSSRTPRIQEALLLLEHMLCEFVETALFPAKGTRLPRTRRKTEKR